MLIGRIVHSVVAAGNGCAEQCACLACYSDHTAVVTSKTVEYACSKDIVCAHSKDTSLALSNATPSKLCPCILNFGHDQPDDYAGSKAVNASSANSGAAIGVPSCFSVSNLLTWWQGPALMLQSRMESPALTKTGLSVSRHRCPCLVMMQWLLTHLLSRYIWQPREDITPVHSRLPAQPCCLGGTVRRNGF